MSVFPEYAPSAAAFPEHLRRARRLGLFPLFLTLILMRAAPRGPGPGLWCALGTIAGLYVLLWGAVQFAFDDSGRPTPAGDRYFPVGLFAVQTGWGTVTTLLLWRTLVDLGHRTSLAEQAVLFAVLMAFPAHRWIRSLLTTTELGPAGLRGELFLRYVKRALAALLLALILTDLIRGPDGKIGEGGIIRAIGLWVITVLFVLGCLTFCIERALLVSAAAGQSRRPDTAPPGGS